MAKVWVRLCFDQIIPWSNKLFMAELTLNSRGLWGEDWIKGSACAYISILRTSEPYVLPVLWVCLCMLLLLFKYEQSAVAEAQKSHTTLWQEALCDCCPLPRWPGLKERMHSDTPLFMLQQANAFIYIIGIRYLPKWSDSYSVVYLFTTQFSDCFEL